MKSLIDKAIHGDMDSDRHLISIFAMALASRGKVFVELGVREGHTTEPLYEAAKLVGAHLWSVDLNDPTKYKPNNGNYTFVKQDSIKFLEQWPNDKKIDNTDPFYHCDLTHHEGQWASGGPYRAVAELNPQFWEWSTLPWNNGLTILRKKYSNKYHRR